MLASRGQWERGGLQHPDDQVAPNHSIASPRQVDLRRPQCLVESTQSSMAARCLCQMYLHFSGASCASPYTSNVVSLAVPGVIEIQETES